MAAVAVVCAPGAAFAHVGVGPVHDLSHGLEHPLARSGYVLAMLAVGIWAARHNGGAIWRGPLRFVRAIVLRSDT
jgi:urease accessory protein